MKFSEPKIFLIFLLSAISTHLSATTLETKQSCELIKQWGDKGSGAKLNGRFSLPKLEPGYVAIGGFGVTRKKSRPTDCMIVVKDSKKTTSDGKPFFRKPDTWELIWTDKGTGSKKSGSMWKAISSDDNYRCIGNVPQKGYSEPNEPSYRCVHKSLTKEVVTSSLIWNDERSGAYEQVSMFQLPNSRSFIAVAGRVNQIQAFDLDLPTSVVPPSTKKGGGFLADLGNALDEFATDLSTALETPANTGTKATNTGTKATNTGTKATNIGTKDSRYIEQMYVPYMTYTAYQDFHASNVISDQAMANLKRDIKVLRKCFRKLIYETPPSDEKMKELEKRAHQKGRDESKDVMAFLHAAGIGSKTDWTWEQELHFSNSAREMKQQTVDVLLGQCNMIERQTQGAKELDF